MMKTFEYEGVAYHPYTIGYITKDGRHKTKILYAPGDAWIGETVDRWISDADVPVKRGSNVTIRKGRSRRASRDFWSKAKKHAGTAKKHAKSAYAGARKHAGAAATYAKKKHTALYATEARRTSARVLVDQKRAQPHAEPKKSFYVLLFNYEKGNPDRKLKGYEGPFATKAAADHAYAKEEAVWYPRIVYITPALFEKVKHADSYEAEKVLHGAWKKETGYKAAAVPSPRKKNPRSRSGSRR